MLTLSSRSVAAAEPLRATLDLLWADPGGALRDGFLRRGDATMERELTRIFDAARVDVTWTRLTKSLDPRVEAPILVILAQFDGTRWGLSPETLGAVVDRGGPIACVYVFVPSVQRELGLPRRRSAAHYFELGKALGRVAAHEVVHAILPGLAHGRRGLMQAKLARTDLLRPRLQMVSATSAALSARLLDP